jgi:hypothetical protein
MVTKIKSKKSISNKHDIFLLLILLSFFLLIFFVLWFIVYPFSMEQITAFINSSILHSNSMDNIIGSNTLMIFFISISFASITTVLLLVPFFSSDKSTMKKILRENNKLKKNIVICFFAFIFLIYPAYSISLQLANDDNGYALIDMKSCRLGADYGRGNNRHQECDVLVLPDNGESFTIKKYNFLGSRKVSELKSSRVYIDNKNIIHFFDLNDKIFVLSIILFAGPIFVFYLLCIILQTRK